MTETDGRRATIFLIEEDDDTRGPLVHNLRGYGYRVLISVDEQSALDMADGGHVPADLILVNLVGKSAEDALELGRRVRERAKYNGHTPLVVMPEKYGKDVEGTEANVGGNDWIFYLGEESSQLRDLLERLTSEIPNPQQGR